MIKITLKYSGVFLQLSKKCKYFLQYLKKCENLSQPYPVCSAEVNSFSKVVSLIEAAVVRSGERDDELSRTLVSTNNLQIRNTHVNQRELSLLTIFNNNSNNNNNNKWESYSIFPNAQRRFT